jgi:probable HAF family extracellular repeat protein
MKSNSVLRNFTSIALSACCVIGISSAGGAQTYSVTDLGVLLNGQDNTSNSSSPAAINAQGQVAGTSGLSAFLYIKENKTPMTDVGGNPAGGSSRGFGINGSSKVVGDSTFGNNKTSHAAFFSDGLAVDLGTLRGYAFSRANGINTFGQAVGSSSDKLDGDNSNAFIVSAPGTMIDLGTLGGAHAQALAINDSGFVTGSAQTVSPGTFGATHAFLWNATTGMRDLGTLDGYFSYGTSINAQNHVVGYSTINRYDSRVHAFLYDGVKMSDLGSLGGASPPSDLSFALGVNAADQVVGYTYLPTDGPWTVAFIYSQGLMKNLNDLIGTAASNYRLDSAVAINDNGQIAAIAFDNSAGAFHAVVLTPIPQIGGDKPNRRGPVQH